MSYIDTRNLNANQLLHAVGLQRLQPTRSAWTEAAIPAALFGAGVLLGAGVALMVAPKSGRELRSDITKQANQLSEKVRERLPNTNNTDRLTHEANAWEPATT
ncbi:MAG: YtxH domain-containing protein [Myxococcota bacterium]